MNMEEAQAKGRATYHNHMTQTDIGPLPTSTSQSELDTLTFTERKVALNLAQFARGQTDLALSSHKVRNLIQTLTAEAPENVEKLVTDAEKATKGKKDRSADAVALLTEEEKKDLEALIELAQRRLRSANP